jgi:hypothetical protein
MEDLKQQTKALKHGNANSKSNTQGNENTPEDAHFQIHNCSTRKHVNR